MNRRKTALLWAYGVFTAAVTVCYVASDLMWELCGYQYGAEPAALYELMQAATAPHMAAAMALMVSPVFLIRLLPETAPGWLYIPAMFLLLWLFPLLLAGCGLRTMVRGRRSRHKLVLGGLHILNAVLLLHMGTRILMSV